jgi:Ca2+-transporting ATPase
MKCAPEMVLERCTKIIINGKVQTFTEENRNKHFKITEDLAKQALRNLAFAYKELPMEGKFTEEMEESFVFIGIISMIDPPRPEVKDAIAVCREAGIRVVMITGDHKLTATAVGKELKLIDENHADEQVITGEQLEKMTDDQLIAVVEKAVIYARVAPEHKVRIVKAWKAKGQVVAMTGDGVNDAPALKMSDIGVAMGISGTEVSKEAADMVLADETNPTKAPLLFLNLRHISFIWLCFLKETVSFSCVFNLIFTSIALPLCTCIFSPYSGIYICIY